MRTTARAPTSPAALTDDQGAFTLHVPADANVTLDAFRRGDRLGTAQVGTGTGPVTIDLPAIGSIIVVATDGANPLPVRVQVLPAGAATLPELPRTSANRR